MQGRLRQGMSLANEFKAFLLRGNVVDLAVAVVIGAAFGAVVTSLANDVLLQIVAAIFGQPDFSDLSFTVNDAEIRYGALLTALINFLIVAFAIFFFVIKPINALIARSRREPPPDPTEKTCPECLSDIPVGARICKYCRSEQPAIAPVT